MNFSFSEDQLTIKDVADKIFRDLCDDDSIRVAFQDSVPFQKKLWAQLAESGLLAASLPTDFGGSELGLTETCLVAEGHGAAVAPIPYVETVVECALAIAEFGDEALKQRVLPGVASGEMILAAVRPYNGLMQKHPLTATANKEGWLLNGDSSIVSYAPIANGFVVEAHCQQQKLIAYVDANAEGISLTQQLSMSGETCGHLSFTNVAVDGDAVVATGDEAISFIEWQQQRTYVALAAQQVGVLKEGLKRAAEYTRERKQFGRPLASFQAVAQQAADGYMAIEALRGVYWRALDDIEAGRDAKLSSRVAKFWVAEAGHVAAHIFLHIHGGIGQDLEYPAHRFFIWAKHNENYIGTAANFAAQLGELVSKDPEAVMQ
ncbi:MAG: acyl-CoA/acyl-ACP dehydrogenase [Pseudomonadales bacterium]|nr:acyl-CoA/acyl-ACP dehydrogenase [Pseudomonadales bacterium]